MKDIINYYYKLRIVDIYDLKDGYLLVDNNNYFYQLCLVKENINIDYILNVLKQINNNKYGILILNKNKEYISKINDKDFVLISVIGIINDKITLNDMIHNNKLFRYLKTTSNNLVDLWSKKIDYLEYQVSELAKNKMEVINSFSFFIGLAENAITFITVNNINFINLHRSLVHLRIPKEILTINYYNPLNLLIDYEIRDYAEYIKSKVLYSDDILKDIKYILDNADLNEDDIKLFYARLMFPTLYFDDIEDILLNNKEEKELDIYIESIPSYLNMLKDTYDEIKKKGISIDIPNWIIKN